MKRALTNRLIGFRRWTTTREVRWTFGGAAIGVLVGLMVGGVGIAMMGSAFGLPGWAVFGVVFGLAGRQVASLLGGHALRPRTITSRRS
jgi:hypothetical protein